MKQKIHINFTTGIITYKEKNIGFLNPPERRVLNKLIEKRGCEVSKTELISAGWPSRVTVSNSLNMAIKKIRSIFLMAEYDNIIITVQRVGFCIPDASMLKSVKNSNNEVVIKYKYFNKNPAVSLDGVNSIASDFKFNKQNANKIENKGDFFYKKISLDNMRFKLKTLGVFILTLAFSMMLSFFLKLS
ncbi:winged helix-turn-helix domain-containing protein [Serratia sp. N21D137]|uniref:winged helix-turn-helix domain-containing protein n=1 Tax=Serratia sp. N21D137 TaxID=3397495 RepID=UPI0039DFDB60